MSEEYPRWVSNVPAYQVAVDQARRGAPAPVMFCEACSQHFFYPRVRCPDCLSDEVDARGLEEPMTVVSYTWVYRPQSVAFLRDVPILMLCGELGPMRIVAEGVRDREDRNVIGADAYYRWSARNDGLTLVPTLDLTPPVS